MEPQQITENEPLRDVFATQGILVILTVLAVVILHIFAPEYCRELLEAWHKIEAESPDAEALAAQLTEWFASIFAG